MQTIYTDGKYLETTETWHSEDSPWKARQILKLIERNSLSANNIAEIGCGAGMILSELSNSHMLNSTTFHGYDISPQAIELCSRRASDRLIFTCEDLLSPTCKSEHFDILLAIDVFEHVPDYLGFIEKCRAKATYKIFHIPLDLHISSVIRKSFIDTRYTLGHLHYFSEQSALASIKDCGHEIIDFFLTDGAVSLPHGKCSIMRRLANIPRRLLSSISPSLSTHLLGGHSLLILSK